MFFMFFYSSLRIYLKHGRLKKYFHCFFRVFLVTVRIVIPFFTIIFFSQHQMVMFPVMKSVFLRILLYATAI